MTVEYKILFNADVPEVVENTLGSLISTEKTTREKYIFTYGGENENLYFSKVDWNKVRMPEFAFLDVPILASEVTQLIIRRAAENVGTLNVDDLKDGLIEKSYTIKILNEYSLGHISDIVLNFAAEREVNTVLIRPYVINLLNFFTSLAKSEVISFPIDLDCGFSNDTFFIQAHCHNNEFVFENILDTLKSGPVGSISGQFEDILKYTDLLNIFTIGTSRKLIFTGCWFYQGIWKLKQKSYPSLIIHDMPFLKLESENVDNSVNTFIKQSLENISKIKIAEDSLAQKYRIKRDNQIIEAINPAKVRMLYRFLKDEVLIPIKDDLNISKLDELLRSYSNGARNSLKSAINTVNEQEKNELLKLFRNNESYVDLDEDVQRVKNLIPKKDYVSEMIRNLEDMPVDDIKSILRSSDEKNDVLKISGIKEEKEHVEVIRGSAERISEGTLKVKSLASDISKDENWEVKYLNIINKMKTELGGDDNLTSEQVNEKLESIVQSELGVEVAKSKDFINHCSDHITEKWLAKGVNNINDEVRQRLRLERVEAQLINRDKQVDKMKELITKLKLENGNLNSHLQDLKKENKAVDYKLRRSEEDRSKLSTCSEAAPYEVDKVKGEVKDLELLLVKMNKELEEKNKLIAKFSAEIDEKNKMNEANEIRSLNETIKGLHQEKKDSILKAKSFEQKLKYATVQIQQYKKQDKKGNSSKGIAGGVDPKVKTQLKNLEMKYEKVRQGLSKMQKELSDKKTELHKAQLEKKTMSAKIRDLEKKLDFFSRKAS